MRTMEITHENVSRVCRLCLFEDGIMLNLFQVRGSLPWPLKIMAFADVQVSPGDGLPAQVCHRCIVQIDNCLAFKEKCEASDVKLRKLLMPSQIFDIEKIPIKPEPQTPHDVQSETSFKCPSDEDSPCKSIAIDEESYLSDDSGADIVIKTESYDEEASTTTRASHSRWYNLHMDAVPDAGAIVTIHENRPLLMTDPFYQKVMQPVLRLVPLDDATIDSYQNLSFLGNTDVLTLQDKENEVNHHVIANEKCDNHAQIEIGVDTDKDIIENVSSDSLNIIAGNSQNECVEESIHLVKSAGGIVFPIKNARDEINTSSVTCLVEQMDLTMISDVPRIERLSQGVKVLSHANESMQGYDCEGSSHEPRQRDIEKNYSQSRSNEKNNRASESGLKNPAKSIDSETTAGNTASHMHTSSIVDKNSQQKTTNMHNNITYNHQNNVKLPLEPLSLIQRNGKDGQVKAIHGNKAITDVQKPSNCGGRFDKQTDLSNSDEHEQTKVTETNKEIVDLQRINAAKWSRNVEEYVRQEAKKDALRRDEGYDAKITCTDLCEDDNTQDKDACLLEPRTLAPNLNKHNINSLGNMDLKTQDVNTVLKSDISNTPIEEKDSQLAFQALNHVCVEKSFGSICNTQILDYLLIETVDSSDKDLVHNPRSDMKKANKNASLQANTLNAFEVQIVNGSVSCESVSSRDIDCQSVSSVTVGSVQSIGDCKTVIVTKFSSENSEAVRARSPDGPPRLLDKRINDWVIAATEAKNSCLDSNITTVHIEHEEHPREEVDCEGSGMIHSSLEIHGSKSTDADCVSARVLPFQLVRMFAKVSSELRTELPDSGNEVFRKVTTRERVGILHAVLAKGSVGKENHDREGCVVERIKQTAVEDTASRTTSVVGSREQMQISNMEREVHVFNTFPFDDNTTEKTIPTGSNQNRFLISTQCDDNISHQKIISEQAERDFEIAKFDEVESVIITSQKELRENTFEKIKGSTNGNIEREIIRSNTSLDADLVVNLIDGDNDDTSVRNLPENFGKKSLSDDQENNNDVDKVSASVKCIKAASNTTNSPNIAKQLVRSHEDTLSTGKYDVLSVVPLNERVYCEGDADTNNNTSLVALATNEDMHTSGNLTAIVKDQNKHSQYSPQRPINTAFTTKAKVSNETKTSLQRLGPIDVNCVDMVEVENHSSSVLKRIGSDDASEVTKPFLKKPKLSHLEALRARWFTSDVATRPFLRPVSAPVSENNSIVQMSKAEEKEVAQKQLEALYEPFNGGGCIHPEIQPLTKVKEPIVRFLKLGSIDTHSSYRKRLITFKVAAAIKKFLSRDSETLTVETKVNKRTSQRNETLVRDAVKNKIFPTTVQNKHPSSCQGENSSLKCTYVRGKVNTNLMQRTGSLGELRSSTDFNGKVTSSFSNNSNFMDLNMESNLRNSNDQGRPEKEEVVPQSIAPTVPMTSQSNINVTPTTTSPTAVGLCTDKERAVRRANSDTVIPTTRKRRFTSTASQTPWKPSLLPALLEDTPVGIVTHRNSKVQRTSLSSQPTKDEQNADLTISLEDVDMNQNEKQTQTVYKLEWKPPLVNVHLEKYSIPKRVRKVKIGDCSEETDGHKSEFNTIVESQFEGKELKRTGESANAFKKNKIKDDLVNHNDIETQKDKKNPRVAGIQTKVHSSVLKISSEKKKDTCNICEQGCHANVSLDQLGTLQTCIHKEHRVKYSVADVKNVESSTKYSKKGKSRLTHFPNNAKSYTNSMMQSRKKESISTETGFNTVSKSNGIRNHASSTKALLSTNGSIRPNVERECSALGTVMSAFQKAEESRSHDIEERNSLLCSGSKRRQSATNPMAPSSTSVGNANDQPMLSSSPQISVSRGSKPLVANQRRTESPHTTINSLQVKDRVTNTSLNNSRNGCNNTFVNRAIISSSLSTHPQIDTKDITSNNRKSQNVGVVKPLSGEGYPLNDLFPKRKTGENACSEMSTNQMIHSSKSTKSSQLKTRLSRSSSGNVTVNAINEIQNNITKSSKSEMQSEKVVEKTKRESRRKRKPKLQGRCKICGKTFVDAAELLSHRAAHREERLHVCQFCDKRFKTRTNLRNHEYTHTKMSPHVCTQCGRRFLSKVKLDTHMNMHAGVKPHVCDTCQSAFYSRSVLMQHQRSHLQIRPHKCDTCDKSYTSITSLRQHIRTHTGERPYICNACRQRFINKTQLISHIARFHVQRRDLEEQDFNIQDLVSFDGSVVHGHTNQY